MTITTITVFAADDTMGDNTPEYCAGYRAWLRTEVQREFPAADVDVRNEPSTNNVRTDAGADDYADLERLQQFVQASWDRVPAEF